MTGEREYERERECERERVRAVLEVATSRAGATDRVAVEAPLLLRLRRRGAPLGADESTLLMRTPGDDEDLVRGFLLSEGLLGHERDLLALQRPADLSADERGNVLVAELGGASTGALQRFSIGSSSCGACGKTSIDALAVNADLRDDALSVTRSVLLSLPDRMRAQQPGFHETGGMHASGLYRADGATVLVREDVGRHNALDKVVGWALREGRLPLRGHVLLVSGRVSYDLVQKAIVAGIPVLAAIGAPSSFAIALAERAGVSLVGFLRGGSMTVYSHPHRIVDH